MKCLALEGGPPSFPQDFSCPVVLRIPTHARRPYPYRTVTVSGAAFQQLRVGLGCADAGPTTPQWSKPPRFGLGPISLATTLGISVDFFSSGYCDVSVR